MVARAIDGTVAGIDSFETGESVARSLIVADAWIRCRSWCGIGGYCSRRRVACCWKLQLAFGHRVLAAAGLQQSLWSAAWHLGSMELRSNGAGIADCKNCAMVFGDVCICHEDIVIIMTVFMFVDQLPCSRRGALLKKCLSRHHRLGLAWEAAGDIAL